jgi:hypothetical protein
MVAQHGLPWLLTHERESLESAEMWATIGELVRGILGPAKCRAHALDERSATGASTYTTWRRDNHDWQVTPTGSSSDNTIYSAVS